MEAHPSRSRARERVFVNCHRRSHDLRGFVRCLRVLEVIFSGNLDDERSIKTTSMVGSERPVFTDTSSSYSTTRFKNMSHGKLFTLYTTVFGPNGWCVRPLNTCWGAR